MASHFDVERDALKLAAFLCWAFRRAFAFLSEECKMEGG